MKKQSIQYLLLGLLAVMMLVTISAVMLGDGHVTKVCMTILMAVAGTTVLYDNIGATALAGSTTAPTAAQAANASMLTGRFVISDAETSVVITHNFGISATDLTANFPKVTCYAQGPPGSPTAPLAIAWNTATANAITANKSNTANSGGTYLFFIERPHTMIR